MKRMRFKRFAFYFSSEKGLSLIEILASVTILFILTLSLLPMFVQSARTNNASEDIMNSTYLAESSMETVESLVGSLTAIDSTFSSSMGNNGFTQTVNGCSTGTCYEKNTNGHYVFVQLTNSGSANQLVDAKVKVFMDNSKTRQQAQMESLLSWKK